MKDVYRIRQAHGGTFLTAFPDGLLVPWKPLPVEDWIKYTRDYNRAVIPDSYLEDEIFKKCVLDDSVLRQMDFLPAGVVTTVVTNIWQHSGPPDSHSLAEDLNTARAILHAEGVSVIHDLARLITMAFPYTPEQVYALDYETMLLRAAQAEAKLIALGIFKKPISIEIAKQQGAPQESVQKSSPRVDALRMYEEQEARKQQEKESFIQKETSTQEEMSREKWWKDSPVLETKKRKKINFDAERTKADSFVLDSHDLLEPPEMQEFLVKQKTEGSRAKMVKDAAWIYKDLIERLRK